MNTKIDAGPRPASQPAATAHTRPNNDSGITAVRVAPLRKVTYAFNATSSANLQMPYVVAVDGKAQAAFDNGPKRVLGKGGKIQTFVEQGRKVSLYLNSDAHRQYRQHPVYEVSVGGNDIMVIITEKSGKRADPDTPLRLPAPAGNTAPVDRYSALLTGDIWMKVSHRYTAAEVDALVEPGTRAAVVAAVKQIYAGLSGPTMTVADVVAGQPRRVTVQFSDSDNPKANITRYSLLEDGLPRVHPAGYAAMITAALDNGIEFLNVTSCWRPMLGSIAHRAGLGLDVNYIGKTKINRQELRAAVGEPGAARHGAGNGNDADNVTDAEVRQFAAYEDAVVAEKKARAERIAAESALEQAERGGNEVEVAGAKERLRLTNKAVDDSSKAARTAYDAWGTERDAYEPNGVKLFRTSLLKCRCVSQLFDPWFMDVNTHDDKAPEPNMQRGRSSSNERLHAHHLHITVHEPQIL